MEKKAIVGLLSLIFVVCGVALGVGMYYAGYNAERPLKETVDIDDALLEEIQAANIDEFLRHLSSVPHLAGTDEDLKQAQWIHDKFIEFGLDSASVIPYKVLLSYPDKTEPNRIHLLDGNGKVNYSTSGKQPPLFSPEEDSPLVALNFNAYSATGTPKSGLVYVYYGRQADYDVLAKNGVNVSGNIVLARYGEAFRGNIVDIAERNGAAGVLLFSDPKDFAQQGRDNTYPNSWWMPGKAVQYGTVYLNDGDPMTPYYPSIESAYRNGKGNKLPSIPVQPIGYDEAEVFLKALDEVEGNRAPDEWQGSLSTVYYLGPTLKNNGQVQMNILTSNQVATIHNTIGMIYGEDEPDRYVLMGNHRDAWILGAVDPSSGTAAMLEMARAFGKMKQSRGWRPRRTLVFCSWGAEEYGLIGSNEWAEEHAKILSQRAVAYLNVDIAVEGNHSLFGDAAPLMHKVLVDGAKRIKNPNAAEVASGRSTVFDTWAYNFPDKIHDGGFPEISILGSGSDYASLMHRLGIPSLDFRYTHKEAVGSYPLYHTLYDTHYLEGGILDQGFLYHRACAQLWAEIARVLAESVVLPMDIDWYAGYLNEAFEAIQAQYGERLTKNNASLTYFQAAVRSFQEATKNYSSMLGKLDTNDALAVRRINDQLIQLERHFIDPRGLPDRPQYNHIVFAPSASDTYSSSSFSGLTDLLEAVGNQTETERPDEWDKIKLHLSVIAFYIGEAAKSLSDYLQ